jgi:transmembrane sensor
LFVFPFDNTTMINRDLLDKLRDGRCTPDELAILRAYFAQPDLSDLNQWLTDDWQQLAQTPLPNITDDPAHSRVWQRLQAHIRKTDEPVETSDREPPVIPFRKQHVWGRWAVAASVALVLLVGAGLWWNGQGAEPMAVVQRNETSKPMKIMLDDGSVVWLSPKSTLTYQRPMIADERALTLDGEAYFSVARDTTRPFTVQTSLLLVRVLGTSFTVRSFAREKNAEVRVRTGRVSVRRSRQAKELVLRPNERLTVGSPEQPEAIKTLVAAPEIVNPKAVVNRFVFADTPVADVFGELERAYGVTIRHDRQTLANCTITARLSEQPLFTKLDMICASIGASYRIDGTTVVVQSAGCE